VDQGSKIYAKSRERFRDIVFLHIDRLLTSVNEVFTNRRVDVVTLLTLHNIIILIPHYVAAFAHFDCPDLVPTQLHRF
jgi:hypothetical protein